MNSRKAADLLYESEATLRLVETALNEIRGGNRSTRFGLIDDLRTMRGVEPAGECQPDPISESRIRIFWQIQEVADSVRESRELLQRVIAPVAGGVRTDEGAGFDRILSLIDRLDPAARDDSEGTSEAQLYAELRAEVLGLIGNADADQESARDLSLANSLLSEAEGRLTLLGYALDVGD